jgi:hypothetical protein
LVFASLQFYTILLKKQAKNLDFYFPLKRLEKPLVHKKNCFDWVNLIKKIYLVTQPLVVIKQCLKPEVFSILVHLFYAWALYSEARWKPGPELLWCGYWAVPHPPGEVVPALQQGPGTCFPLHSLFLARGVETFHSARVQSMRA